MYLVQSGATKNLFLHVDEYATRPDDADEKGRPRYEKKNSVIKMFVCISAVFPGLSETMNWYGECHLLEKLVKEWMPAIGGKVIKFKHNESFGLKFAPGVPEEEIKTKLGWIGEQYKMEVKAMGYRVEKHRDM